MGRTAKDIGGLVKDLIAIEDIETKKGFIRKYQALPIKRDLSGLHPRFLPGPG